MRVLSRDMGRVIAGLAVLGAAVQPAAAFTLRPHPDVKATRLLFTEALFGWCGDQVAGHAFVPTKMDPMGAGWEPSDENATPVRRPAKGKPAPPAALARTHSDTGVMVELSPDKSRCYVQMEADRSDVLVVALKALLVRPPLSATPVQTLKALEGESSVYALRAGKGGPPIAISITEYTGTNNLISGELRRDPGADQKPGDQKP